MDVEFVCLANSRKMGGRCVAGIGTNEGGWIRPVADTQDGTLGAQQYVLDDQTPVAVLDVVTAEVIRREPKPHQPENWVVGARRWRRVRTLDAAQAQALLTQHIVEGPELFGTLTDRVEFETARQRPLTSSLAIIKPERIAWVIDTWGAKRKTRVRFTLARRTYDLGITDPLWEARLANLPVGGHRETADGFPPEAARWFTVSLGEPFHGFCYKLVAAVLVFP